MKTLSIAVLILLFSSCSFLVDKKELLPSFDVLLLDSTTIFNTDSIPRGKPFVMMHFSPDCEHCQQQVEDILENMNCYSGVQFYFFTPFEFNLLKGFYEYYHLYNYPNIMIGYDFKFFIPTYFKTTSTPWVFIYNKNKKLKSVYEGGLSIPQLMEAVSKNN